LLGCPCSICGGPGTSERISQYYINEVIDRVQEKELKPTSHLTNSTYMQFHKQEIFKNNKIMEYR
jgi:hypothetical protein